MISPRLRFPRRAAFTLSELMVAVGVFAVGAALVYPLYVADFALYTRNFSINKSNNSLRYSLQTLTRDIQMAVESPLLMTYRVSGSLGILKPADPTNATTGVVTTPAISGTAIMMWVNLGPAYDLVATPGTSTAATATNPGNPGTISPSTGVTLRRAVALPTVQVGDRLMILNPTPYSTNMPDIVTMDGAKIQKPGRRINAITNVTATQITVQLDLTATATGGNSQPGTPLPSPISAQQTAFILREVAYVTKTITDASNNAIERQLLYYPTTNNMSDPKLVVRDLDPLPQEIDQITKLGVQPFNYYGGRSNTSSLSVILPIRALDYARGLNDRSLAGAATNTSWTEFDVYLRSAPQLTYKAKLD